MGKEHFSATLSIGGAVSASLDRAFGTATKKVRELSAAGKAASTAQTGIGRFVKAQAAVTSARADAAAEMKRLADLNGQSVWISSAEELTQLNKEIDAQKAKVQAARKALADKTATLDKHKATLKAAGVDTDRLSDENERLAAESERSAAAIKRIKEAQSAASKASANLSRSWGNLKSRAVQATAAITAVGYAAFRTISGFSKQADDVRDIADALGMTSQQLQALQYAGEHAGLSTEQMNQGLKTLKLKLAEAVDGSSQANYAFSRIGLDAFSLQAMDAEQQMSVLAEAFRNYRGPIDKAKLANDIFGGSGVKMANVLNDGAAGLKAMREEGEKTGFILTPEQVEIAKKYDDSLKKLSGRLIGIRNQIGASIMPVLTRFFDYMSEHPLVAKAAVAAFATVLGGAAVLSMGRFVVAGVQTVQALRGMAAAMSGLLSSVPALSALGSSVLPALSGGITAVGAAIAATPVGWILAIAAGIALVGAAVYKFWQPIKAFFSGIGQGIAEAFEPVMPLFRRLGDAFGAVFGWLGKLLKPVQLSADALGKFTSVGRTLGRVLTYAFLPPLAVFKAVSFAIKNGRSLLGSYFSFLGGLGGKLRSLFGSLGKALLDIILAPFRAVKWLWDRLFGGDEAEASGPAQASRTVSGVPGRGARIPARGSQWTAPAVEPARGASSTVNNQSNITLNVNTQPGQSPAEFARAAADELERRQAQAARSSLFDTPAYA